MCTCTHDCRHDNQHLVHTRTRRGASISCNASESESEPSASTIKQRNRKRCWNQTGQGFSHRQCCQNDDPCQHERTRGKGKKVQKKHRHQLQVVQVQVHVSNKLKYTRYTAYLFLLLLLDASILHPVHSDPQSNLPNHNRNHNHNSITSPSSVPNQISKREQRERERERTPNTNKQKSSLVEVYEHEYYCKQTNTWLGGSSTTNATGININTNNSASDSGSGSSQPKSTRWTSSPKTSGGNVKILPPPSELSAPKGYEYVGEWKIDVTGEGIKDDLGWEYYVSHTHGQRVGRRRRRWLRTVVLEVVPVEEEGTRMRKIEDETQGKEEHVKDTSRTHISVQRAKITTIQTPTQKLLKQMTDSFNFKGYGITASKSLLTKTMGFAWRLPLSTHFDFWESRPYLPILTSSIAIYFPFHMSFLVNASLPLELLQTAIWAGLDWSMWVCIMLYCVVLQTIVWDVLGKMILWNSIKATGKLLALGPMEDEEDTDSEKGGAGRKEREMALREREGSLEERMKKWWREDGSSLSVLGREYPSMPKRRRVVYNPSITDRLGGSVGMHLSKSRGLEVRWTWWHIYLPTVDFLSTKFFPKSRKRKKYMYQWMREKFAALGFAWGGFAPEAPHYSCSSIFTLSGLYPSDAWKKFCEMQAERKSRWRISKTLKNAEEDILSESEYEEIVEVKVGAS